MYDLRGNSDRQHIWNRSKCNPLLSDPTEKSSPLLPRDPRTHTDCRNKRTGRTTIPGSSPIGRLTYSPIRLWRRSIGTHFQHVFAEMRQRSLQKLSERRITAMPAVVYFCQPIGRLHPTPRPRLRWCVTHSFGSRHSGSKIIMTWINMRYDVMLPSIMIMF